MHHEAAEDEEVAGGDRAGQALVTWSEPPKATSPSEAALDNPVARQWQDPRASRLRERMIPTEVAPRAIAKIPAKIWEGISAGRPMLYLCLILMVVVAAYLHDLHSSSIFACQAHGYSSDRYLAYCNTEGYGDYDHGAFYFGLEPSAQRFVRDADAILLGNSRLQFAFSTPATADWFAAVPARYYLLGFLYFENEFFEEKLLERIQPTAKVYVINLDNFFNPSETTPVKSILLDRTARSRYEGKRLWQRVHAPICRTISVLCGDKYVVFRSRKTGTYYRDGVLPHTKSAAVTYDWTIDQTLVTRNTVNAMNFLARFAHRKCVILTIVPYIGTKIGDAKAIATRLRMKLIVPEGLHSLRTFDGYHLDRSSAQRWSQAFFQVAGSQIRSCLEERDATRRIGSTLSALAR